MEAATHMLRTGRRGPLFEYQMAFRDLRASIGRADLAWSLAWHDVSSRYRGSILGPFWITLSMGLMVVGIGVVYANLFGIALKDFLPLVALGIVFFGSISGTVTEGCETFVQAAMPFMGNMFEKVEIYGTIDEAHSEMGSPARPNVIFIFFGLPGPARNLLPLEKPARYCPRAHIFSQARPMGRPSGMRAPDSHRANIHWPFAVPNRPANYQKFTAFGFNYVL